MGNLLRVAHPGLCCICCSS